MARGKKDCPNCKEEIGARTQLCDCGWHYPSDKVRKDLLGQKVSQSGKKVHTTAGRGRKTCPDCEKIVGVRTQTCECGFDFSGLAAKKAEEKEEEKAAKKKSSTKVEKAVSPEVAEMMKHFSTHYYPYDMPSIGNAMDHAVRLLESCDTDHALFLLSEHKKRGCWSHVDWDHVEEQLLKEEEN